MCQEKKEDEDTPALEIGSMHRYDDLKTCYIRTFHCIFTENTSIPFTLGTRRISCYFLSKYPVSASASTDVKVGMYVNIKHSSPSYCSKCSQHFSSTLSISIYNLRTAIIVKKNCKECALYVHGVWEEICNKTKQKKKTETLMQWKNWRVMVGVMKWISKLTRRRTVVKDLT